MEHIISKCPHLELVGLMTIGSINHSLGEGLNPDFERLEKCKQEVCRKFDFDADKFELSMGMSSDFETAVSIITRKTIQISDRNFILLITDFDGKQQCESW